VAMKDYYKILGVSQSAPEEKIRRAYRTLARRYHPDVNPDKGSTEKFKDIAEAYQVLTDPVARKKYLDDYAVFLRTAASAKIKAYQAAAERRAASGNYYEQQKRDYRAIKAWQSKAKTGQEPEAPPAYTSVIKRGIDKAKARLAPLASRLRLGAKPLAEGAISKLSLIEVPVTLQEAIYGVKKTVNIEEPEGERKINVTIPAGVRSGSIVRLKSPRAPDEEVVLVVRLERHSHISIDAQGLVVDIPITVGEAVSGATIKVPTLDDQVMVKLQPNTQSGAKIRVKDKGIPGKDGPGDLFVRVLVRVPESELAVGLKEKCAELDLYYEAPVRAAVPKTLLEPWS
jgi:curved DNA-binding protein